MPLRDNYDPASRAIGSQARQLNSLEINNKDMHREYKTKMMTRDYDLVSNQKQLPRLQEGLEYGQGAAAQRRRQSPDKDDMI